MRNPVSAEVGIHLECRTVVNKAPVLSPDEQSVRQIYISSAAVYESGPSLVRSAYAVARGSKGQSPDAGLEKRSEPSLGDAEYIGTRPLMLICLYTGLP